MRPGLLHPSRIVTGARDSAAIGLAKRWFVRRLYDYLARAYPFEDWTTMNYGYACLGGDVPSLVPPADASERAGLRLYGRIATSGRRGSELAGLDMLEVGSGRGGGAAFLASTLAPARYVGLDRAALSVALANERYRAVGNLSFVEGDAEDMSIATGSVDVVLNIESAHCYASVARFLTETARVLRPGGELLFAGFAARPGGAYDRLTGTLRAAPLTLDRLDDITPNVVAALREDEERKRELIGRTANPLIRSFAVGAYAMQGTAMRRALESGATTYVAAVLTKR